MIIRGKVSKLIDEFTIMIDKGYSDGVRRNMKFSVYEEGPMIKDLEGNDIEKLEIVKVLVTTSTVMEFTSIARGLGDARPNWFDIGVRRIAYTEEPSNAMKLPLQFAEVGDLVRSDYYDDRIMLDLVERVEKLERIERRRRKKRLCGVCKAEANHQCGSCKSWVCGEHFGTSKLGGKCIDCWNGIE